MKNLIFKSSFHEKLKVLIIPMMLLTLGTGQMWATYYYRGEKNSWGATAMTDVNGIYSYYSATSGAHQFKISTSTSSYDYNYTYVTKNYKQTDVSNIGDYSSNNCYCWQSSAHYILVFNPNTSVNSTNKPIICAATALPSAGFESDGNTISYYNNVDGDKQSSALNRTDGTTIDLTSKAITDLYLKAFNTKMYQHYEVNLLDKTAYHFYYKIHRTAEAAGSTGFTEITSADGYSAGSVTWGSFDGSKYRKPTYYVTANQSLLSGLGSGLYTMSYYFTHVGTTETYRLPSASSKYNELKWKIPVPAVTSGAVTSNGTGSGTSESPFSVADGNTITFTASGSQASTDANSVLYVKWGSDSYAPASSTTKTITPTTTKQSMTVQLKYYNSADDLSGAETTLTIYYQSTLTPSIAISSFTQSGTPVTSVNSGESLTINASRQNAGTASITYQYSTNGSSWTTISSATATSVSWTAPAVTSTTTYYIRAKMTYQSTTYTSSNATLKVYGKKTIKVKNTNNWSSVLMHRWGGDRAGTSWPGDATQISDVAGQWKQVVLYSSNDNFALVDGSNSNNHTADQTYAGMTDGNCYEIQSGTGGSLTLTSVSCPSEPSVTTASASSVATTSATFNASGVNANNDAITAYGFKWGTTDACSSGTVTASNLGAGTTFSASQTGLTNGTTYYYKAYATNGFGTTYGSVQSFRTKYVTTVTLNPQGGTGGTESVTATEGSAMPSGKTAPGKTGYTFGGYYANAGGSGTQYYSATMTSAHNWDVAASTAEIHAKWTAIDYPITYELNGGSKEGLVPWNPDTYTIEQNVPAFTVAPVRNGYTFAGWYTDIDLTTPISTPYVITIGTTGAKTYYAKWTPNQYTVSFDNNGSSDAPPSPITVTYGAAYGTLPAGPTPPGAKSFIGWFTDPTNGTQVTAETIVSTAGNHTLYAHFEETFTVTIKYICGSDVLRQQTTVQASAVSVAGEISAPTIVGYAFSSWTCPGGGATITNASSAKTTIHATAATYVVANYTAQPTVYFKNNLGWDSVFVSFNCTWNEVAGKQVPSNKGKPYYAMTKLGQTDIYYCTIPSTYTDNNYANWAWYIAFDNTNYGKTATTTHSGTWNEFYEGEFLGRKDFDPNQTMFIPYNGDTETRNGGTYYRTGCWMQYNTNYSGYKVCVWNNINGNTGDQLNYPGTELETTVAGSFEFKAIVHLDQSASADGLKLYKDKLKNTNEIWYTNVNDADHTITSNTTTLPWHFESAGNNEDWQRCRFLPEVTGDYTFSVSFATGRPVVNIEYPVSVGDYQLVYKDRATWSHGAHDANWYHPSRIIKKGANAIDTVSFYVAYGSSPAIELHKCESIDGSGNPVWDDGTAVTLGATATGIYNYKITQNADATRASVEFIGGYNGNFYIRTDASDGGWTNYKTAETNNMTYSEYSIDHGGYSHYFMRHVDNGSNIKFVIANDYSPCISDTLVDDDFAHEWIECEANVRFMWYHATNCVSRAYISGSSIISDRFLVLEGNNMIMNEDGTPLSITGLNPNEKNFVDDQNWIYEATIKAKPTARVKLTAKFNNLVQYFKGTEGAFAEGTTVQLIGGTGTDAYKVRVIYDFKTNRLVAAWLPDNETTITADWPIQADIMVLRYHQEGAKQIKFSGSGALSSVLTVYGAMQFNKYRINNKSENVGHANLGLSAFERDLYWISFPFEVNLRDVFGFGTYGKHWIIEYYDGKTRAEKGFWVDSDTNWKFVTPAMRNNGYTLEANQGYVLALDLDNMTEESDVWAYGTENVYLYFPSTAHVDDIQAIASKTINIDQTGYYCSINRGTTDGDRRVKDSYWHVLGVPSYANASHETATAWTGTVPNIDPDNWTSSAPYIYEWVPSTNKYKVHSSASMTFLPMHSYYAQYAQPTITWTNVNATPASVAARRDVNYQSVYELRLEMNQGDEMLDQTYVSLRDDEAVTNEFDFSYDLSKMTSGSFAKTSCIYTMIGYERAAANCLPLETETATVVPVGVNAAADGEYIFSIPDGTEGVGVILIDNETGARTNLALTDYAAYLTAGNYDERFVLEISPIEQIVTKVEEVTSDGVETGGCKKLIDGVLYIVKDGKVFDARGARIQ